MVSKAYGNENMVIEIGVDSKYKVTETHKEICRILREYGIKINLLDSLSKKTLIVIYNKRIYYKKKARNAGRKIENINIKALNISIGEIKKLQQYHSNEEIYFMLGMAKATFYRYLKYHREKGSQETEKFIFE